ncbi:MAG: MFS transporter [Bacteroidetes bacterium]|nr:MFS transporter [Bacteroidota bacterium]
MTQSKQPTNTGALATLVIVFFFWGFIAASNSIFIPFCRTHFKLDQFESQLIGSAFYGAYFFGSFILYIVSSLVGYDILNKIGYKKGIIYGLWISVVGALLIIPSANANSFPAILASFFVVALGFSLQQTAAQPFAIVLGDPSTGSHRLNLAGGVNSLGTTLGPIIVSFFLFGTPSSGNANVTVTNVNNLYMIVAAVFAAVALFFTFSKLPDGKDDAKFESSSKASTSLVVLFLAILLIILVGHFTSLGKLPLTAITLVIVVGILYTSYGAASKNGDGWGAMKYQQLILGMIGIFLYVGVEVTIDNNFGALLKTPGYITEAGMLDSEISKYISLYWGSLMIGRWTGAIGVFNLSESGKRIATIVVPFVAFGIILFVNSLYGNNIKDLVPYSICVIIAIAAFFYGQQKPVKTLLTLALLATFAMLFGVMTKGIISVYAFMSGGLCCSIMWPCIFSLGVAGLGKYTSQGSAFLIMMILGGAVIPPFQGSIGDSTSNMHISYLVAACCFAALALLAVRFRAVLKSQGLNFDEQIGGGH